ncbi:MAG: hypothetical protein Kilf2KO_37560 [Rhodospirillales bacterium]
MRERTKESGSVRFEPPDRMPHGLAAALGTQSVVLILAGIVLTPVVVLRASGAGDGFAPWAIFMAMLVSGLVTIVQGLRVGRIGAGYLLFMGTSGAFISVSVEAIEAGGIALLMTLIVASSLLQFPLAAKLSLLRRIITPTVGGTAIMLIAVTVMPIAFEMLSKVPEEVAPAGAPLSALATLTAILLLSIFGAKRWRLWSPLFGVLVGMAVAAAFGLVDFGRVAEAAWIGFPVYAWPGFDLDFGPAFWQLLPAFMIVTLVGAIETFGDGIAIQRVSWRRPRAVDFRAVQGAVYADGLGNLLSGLGGTLPNTTYSTSIALADITGVAARRVAIWGGAVLILLAFSPKLAQTILAIPNPVAGAYIVVLLLLLFMQGLTLVMDEGLTYERSLVVGFGFWLGIGFQNQALFHDHLPGWAAAVLDNGMTAGTLVAILLSALFALKQGRRTRLKVPLAAASLPQVRDFLQDAARRAGWDRPAINRLTLAAEETLVILLEQAAEVKPRLLRLDVRAQAEGIELDIVAGRQDSNLEDAIARQLGAEVDSEAALSFRILASIVEELHHRQYQGIDFITLKVACRAL